MFESELGMWVLTSYDACAIAFRSPAFGQGEAAKLVRGDPRFEWSAVLQTLGSMMVFMDPPDHTRLRRIVSRAFSPQVITNLRPYVQRVVDELVESFSESEEVDLVTDFTDLIPVTVVCELLGVPHADHEQCRAWSEEIALAIEPAVDDDTLRRADVAMLAYRDYFTALVAEKRAHPQDDLLTLLMRAEDDGDRLTTDELVAMATLVIGAGFETTRNGIAGGCWRCTPTPQSWTACAENHSSTKPPWTRSCASSRPTRARSPGSPSRTSRSAVRPSPKAPWWLRASPPPIAILPGLPIRIGWSSTGPTTCPSRLRPGRTCASAPPWPAWRLRWPSGPSCAVFPICRSWTKIRPCGRPAVSGPVPAVRSICPPSSGATPRRWPDPGELNSRCGNRPAVDESIVFTQQQATWHVRTGGSAVADDFSFDPFDAAFFEDPYPAYARMRTEFPAYRRENENPRVWPHYWMLSRAADVDAAAADWRTFSSATGTLIDIDVSLLPLNMFNMDPPRHDTLRKTLSRVLTPSRVAGLEPFIRQHAMSLIDGFKSKGVADATTEFAQLIPSTVVCELMGLPRQEQMKFLNWNLATIGGADFTSPEALQAYGEMEAYWRGLVAERKDNRTDDLISQIYYAKVEDDADLTDEEISGFCSLLHDASQNTTINMIANAVIVLARHPDERRKLAAEPERWPAAIEELLRFVSPVQGLARSTTRDVEIGGTTIPEGDQVLLLYGSANHDESAFPEPERLDLDRQVKSHWTFGHGIHYCLGAAVAKLETRVALECLVSTLGDWDVDEDGIERAQLVPTRGVLRTPITFEAQPAP